jgi:excisionase family DNA binding protein
MTNEKLYTVQELAEWLKCSRDFIEKAVKEGKLDAIRPGGGRSIRIRQSALESWMNAGASV